MHLRGIMDEVLQLARIQAGKVDFAPSPANLDELCDEIIEEFESIPEHNGRIQFSCPVKPVLVALDKRLMRQVVTNFISNALKYSDRSKQVEIALTVENSQAIFKVSDQGIGIPEDDMKRLFEPFHRAANVGSISGTGLGLSITRQAVELHDGTIVVDSAVNVGTTFTMMLPALVKRSFKPDTK
jgi:signal transduction histidine kinase